MITIFSVEANNELKEIPERCIKGATLLSDEEVEKLLSGRKEHLRVGTKDGYRCWWWLRSPGIDMFHAVVVDVFGSIYYEGHDVDKDCGGIRPALQLWNIRQSNFKVGDMFSFGGRPFRIISSKYALCDEMIGVSEFRHNPDEEDANVYEKSDAKKVVDAWFKESIGVYHGIKTDDMIAEEQDYGF